MNYKHDLGLTVKSRVSGVAGVLTSRSENMYGCNRYYIQPRVGKDNKLPDGWWVDEDDVEVDKKVKKIEQVKKQTGGPISKVF